MIHDLNLILRTQTRVSMDLLIIKKKNHKKFYKIRNNPFICSRVCILLIQIIDSLDFCLRFF